MKGVGIDIVEIVRFKKIERLNRFLELVFLPEEITPLQGVADKFAYIASRFAAKEAVVKAVPKTIFFNEFYISKNGAKPTVEFLDKKKHQFKIFLSLSHSENYAAATAVVE